jgi:hypothetical protein
VPLEDGHSYWEVLLDDPLDKCLVGLVLLAIVSKCVFQRLAAALHWDFGHLDALVADTLISVRKNCV